VLAFCLYVCLERRRDQSSVRTAVSLLTLVRDQFRSAYEDFVAFTKGEARAFLDRLQLTDPEDPPAPKSAFRIFTEELLSVLQSVPPLVRSSPIRLSPDQETTQMRAAPEVLARVRQTVELAESATIQRLITRLQFDADKGPIIRSLSAHLSANNGGDLVLVLPHLIRLAKGAFSAEVERAMQTISFYIDSATVLDAAVPLLADADPEPFVEFLIRVVAWRLRRYSRRACRRLWKEWRLSCNMRCLRCARMPSCVST
jgi:hypothetical protein